MQTGNPLVSVIVPSFNAAPFLGPLCRSLQAQTFADFEVLIGDDGSTDATRESVAVFLKDDRFRYWRWERNRGVTRSTLFLLGMAKGEFWGYPGADDLYEPRFLEERVAFLQAHPSVGLVHGFPRLIDAAGAAIEMTRENSPMWFLPWPEKEVMPADQALALLLQHNIVNTPSVLIRMAATRTVLPWMNPEWRYAQDWAFWMLHTAAGYDIAFDRRALHAYRILSTSLTHAPEKQACRYAELRLVPLWSLSRAAGFSFAACKLWARWGKALYALWLRRAWQLTRMRGLDDAWLQLGAQAYYGPRRGQVKLWPELVRHAGSVLTMSARERSAKRRQSVNVAGFALADVPFFRSSTGAQGESC